ncbi:MAG: GNAT family N-acetyltransferase [Ignavibacteriae bacterium]|nr:GNAT family N-acetyltransferase [Ignavibacteria bacterium]MBI3365754.1 GNAT family N-acetyltransferase [Ignavibacteriota bacterium]
MPSNQITIRTLTKKDGRAFLTLIDALADFEKLKRPTRTARARLLRDALGKQKRFDVYLAFVDTKTVGYAIVFETYSSFLARPTLYLEDIFVLPECRNRKIGLQLFRTCVSEAKRRNCGRMEWMVLDWNVNAIRFYDALGARQLKTWLPYRLVQEQFSDLLESIS